MADILIRGMEMPKKCDECKVAMFCLSVSKPTIPMQIWIKTRPEWCPLVPLPAGHGRLVDAREVLEKADKAPWFDGDLSELGLLLGSEVTTIVPPEGGNADA